MLLVLLALVLTSGCRAKRQAARATALARTPTAVAQAPTETPQPGPSPSPVAAPVEAPAAREAILFQDDFQDGRADDTWQVQGAWTVQQDGERYTLAATGQGLAWVQGGGEWTDYAYRAAVRLSAGPASLIFRGSRQGRYELRFTPRGTSLRRQPAAAAPTTLAESDLVLAAGRWHKVAIVARGGQITLRLDDARVLSATDDDPLLAGTVGVLAEAGTEVSVDNVLVIALGPTTGATPIAEAPTVPRIHSFTTDDEVITAGQCTNLRWQVSGAERVTINQRPVSGDWLEVCPTETTRYLLRADGQQAMLSIDVLPQPSPFSGPPRIVSFDADEAFLLPGQATTLRWDVREAQLIQINDQPWLQAETSMPVRPAETTTYRLVAINNLGFEEAEFTVEVGELPPPPVIHEFDADDALLIPPERSTTLRWHVTGADLVKLAWLRFPDGMVMDQPNHQVSPRETTEYTLEAYVQGRDEPVTRSLVVEVGEPRFSGPPRIVQFDPDHPYLEQGQPKEIGAGCTLLRWQVENATQIKLNGEDVSSATNYRVCPKVTRSYTLVAGRPGQEPAQATTTVQVGQTRGAGAGEYLEIVNVRQVDGQTAEVTVNYGLEAGHEKIIRLVASALVWNDASAEEEALPQFRSPPLAVRSGQRQATLTLTYRGCREVVSDHVRVEIIERQQAEAGSPEEYVAVPILSAAYEHPDMVWQPVNRILGVRAWRGLLANELNVLVAYCYSGDQGEEVWLGARPSGGDVQEDTFGYVPAHIQAGQSGLARITARYNGQYPSHSEALRVFMRLPPPAKGRFARLEIPFPHDWAPDDIRIIGIRRAIPDDVDVPRGSLLVDVAYALNSRPDVMVEFSAWPEDSSAHLLLSVPHEQWRIQQGHGVQTFQVSYNGYQTVETHYLKARLAKPYDIAPDGSVTLPVLIEDTRPFTHTWTSKLVTTLGSGWACEDLLVPMRGLDGRNWTLEFTSGNTCTATFTPCAEQKRERYDAPGLQCQATDIVRISSPNVDIWDDKVTEPIEVQYIGSPDLTVAAHAGDRPLPGLEVTVTGPNVPDGSMTRKTQVDGDAVFYGLGIGTVAVSIEPEDPRNPGQPNPGLLSYHNDSVHTGPNEVLDVDLAPAYIVTELRTVTFYRDEDPGVDEVQVATLAEIGDWQLPFRWPYADEERSACMGWYEANGGDELQPHIPMFAAREDALPWEPLILTVTGMDNDEIPGEWLFLMDLIESAAQIVGTALEQPYIGAAASALDSFLNWMSTPESLGKVQFGAQPPWAISDLPFEMNRIDVNWQVRRLQPTPGRHLNVQLKNIHILDDGDSWPRGKGDIVVFTRVCDGLGCKVLQFGERDFDDGEVWEINQSIFRSNEQRGAGPYLYLEVGVWDDDSCLENWDMLGIVSTLLTEEDAYGVGVPIIFHDSGYDNGEVTIELEVREE